MKALPPSGCMPGPQSSSTPDVKDALDIPVLGNGDIWEASDAVRMMAETGCDGVIVGRGCLGRPWLFGDLARAFAGHDVVTVPNLESVADTMQTHAGLLVDWFGEHRGIRSFRKHTSWYLKGYPVGPEIRRAMSVVSSLDELAQIILGLDASALPHEGATRMARGHTQGPRPVRLPHRYLEGDWNEPVPEMAISGG
jgi:tRNA-dihydrouridine synthase